MQAGVIRAEQPLGVRNQSVEMRFRVGFNRRHTVQHCIDGMQVALALCLVELARHVAHIVSLIGIRRKRQRRPGDFEIPHPCGQRQNIHLPAGVVDIILTGHGEPRSFEQTGKACPVGRAAPVSHVQRPGRIG